MDLPAILLIQGPVHGRPRDDFDRALRPERDAVDAAVAAQNAALELVPAVLRSEVNSELNFPPNFEGLVLGCIDADFCK